MKLLPNLKNPLVVRTCFSDQASWETFCQEVVKPIDGFDIYLSFVDDKEYQGLSIDKLQPLVSEQTEGFLLIVDEKTLENSEYPVLFVDLVDEPYASFRAIARHVGSISANLSIGNVDFFDTSSLVDEDGIFRNFPDSEPAPPEMPAEVPSRHLYIGNLPYDTTDDLLRQKFSTYGKVISAKIAKDSEGRFRGFGRVEMENLETAQESKNQLNGHELNGRAILVAFDGPQCPD